MPGNADSEQILYGGRISTPRATILPRPVMTSHGPSSPVALFVCPDCGTVFKLPSEGELDRRPWCTHANDYSWNGPSSPESGWTQMEYAEVRIGAPHCNGQAWDDPTLAGSETEANDEEDYDENEDEYYP